MERSEWPRETVADPSRPPSRERQGAGRAGTRRAKLGAETKPAKLWRGARRSAHGPEACLANARAERQEALEMSGIHSAKKPFRKRGPQEQGTFS